MHSRNKTASDEDVDLRHFWSVISRNKWAILGLAGAASLLAALVVSAMTPIFKASVTILIEANQANVVSIEEVYGIDSRAQEYYQTQFEILRSRPLVEKVIEQLGLPDHPEYNVDEQNPGFLPDWRDWVPFSLALQPMQPQMDPLEEAVERYYANLTIEPMPKTQLVNVHFEAADPALAASVANNHAQAYIDSMLNARVAVTELAATWMSERIESLQAKLLESEQRLQEFREREQIVDVEGLKSLPAREINELTSRLVEVRRELSLARIAYVQVYQGRDAPLEDLRGIPAILEDTGVQESQKAEAQAQQKVAEIAKRYGPAHTKMISAQSELAKATENLRDQRRNVAKAIRNKFEAAQAEEVELVKALNRAKQQYQVIGRQESGLLALQREAETNRELYDLFYNRISETTATGDLESAAARIISPAVIPTKPDSPDKGLIIGLVFIASLLAGIAAAFLLDALNNTVSSTADVEEKLKVPLLGALPLLKTKQKKQASLGHVFFDATEPGFNESIRTIRTGISLDSLDNPHRVIVVTSAVGDEGKSTLALNLAFAFAQVENVLLVDADMRRPSIGKELDLPRGGPGLAELIANKAKLPECLTHCAEENLDVLATGFIPPNPLELLSAHNLRNVFRALRIKYDRIIVDCPPILPVSDAAVLSTHADSVVFVVKSDATTVQQVQNGLEQLQRVNAPITGVVVNQLDMKKAGKYSDYGYGGYGDAYLPKPTKSKAA